MYTEWLSAAALAYLLGSIPFGLILTKLTGAGDLRSIGSGNIGATNVLRTGNKGLAAATLLLDAAKGFLAVWLTRRGYCDFSPDYIHSVIDTSTALFAVLGHCFPVWLRFKGGKGVATTMGVALGLAWPIGLAYAVVWLGMLALTRISSLAGMSAAVVAPAAALLTGQSQMAPVLAVVAVVVLILHRENIARLRAGTEPKIGAKS
jgi:acyl phosphate:glycerol-3-phosphate acyltransferase